MPPVFGGAPTCPTCQQKVYFAEQTLGPGGRAFHKLCLKCARCARSLEPRLLVDHEGEAYCKSCHSRSFGTKGYGAGGALVGEYHAPPVAPRVPSAEATKPPAQSLAQTSTSPVSRPPLPPKPAFVTSSPQSTTVSPPVVPRRASTDASVLPRLPAGSQANSTSRTVTTSQPPRQPNALQTPAFSDDEEEALPKHKNRRPLPFPPSQNASRNVLNSPDLCRRCGTQVYFAEQVIAVGSKWHKRCLRCEGCSTTLNSHLLEKDRLPWCKRCYQENFGTGSLGITSRPTLY